jgi:porin
VFQGNYGAYLGLDQLLLKKNRGDPKDAQGLGVFLQYAWASPDRNVASQYLGAGLVYRGLLPRRDEDTCGVGLARVFFSDQLPGEPSAETTIELFYKAKVTPWASLQPDFQYIVTPNGQLHDALVVGLRFTVVL